MAETDNPEAPIVAPRAARFSEGPERKVARRERGHAAPSGPGRLVQFLHDVRAEMKRVSWPGLTEVQNTTIITLIAVIFFAVYLFAIDQGLSRLIVGLDWLIEKIARWLGLA
ncbi:MAG TPA: preprotein translocase subunit SecE [Pyrinomonadaceae bacterium]|nr:preprotein translocase subunit SecE [Pyrinomonadaceae bacterium]